MKVPAELDRIVQHRRDCFRGSVLHADWPVPPRVFALSTLRGPAGFSRPPFDSLNLGARTGDDPAVVTRNRTDLEFHLELPSTPRWLQQVHGTEVRILHAAVADTEKGGSEPIADAAVTASPNVVLAILTADCLPVLFCADDGSAIGAAHAGWRGLAAGVLERTVEALRTPPARLLAWLGPAIGARSYEVGDEVRAAFVDRDQDSARAFEATRPGHWCCDLYRLARRRLAMSGITRVHGGGFDTLADPRFYSWRRDGAGSGRFASLLWLRSSS
ncbi:MAG TPA: peptidoglycan editing factor PgeF [Xanthomonadaceae bacterium]|jgi:YfiH family protein|nr:peptidoglycan editing factor PgeF [Xanthomonadaceae bacterium]